MLFWQKHHSKSMSDEIMGTWGVRGRLHVGGEWYVGEMLNPPHVQICV